MKAYPRYSSRHQKLMQQQMARRERKYPFLSGLDLSLQILILAGIFTSVAAIAYLIFTNHGHTLSHATMLATRVLN